MKYYLITDDDSEFWDINKSNSHDEAIEKMQNDILMEGKDNLVQSDDDCYLDGGIYDYHFVSILVTDEQLKKLTHQYANEEDRSYEIIKEIKKTVNINDCKFYTFID